MSESSEEVSAWRSIVDAVEGFDADLERAFASPTPDLPALHRRTKSRLEALGQSLEPRSALKGDGDDVVRPLAFFFDERVLSRLSNESLEDQQRWPLVQRDFAEKTFGGDEFFDAARMLLDSKTAPRLQLEVYLYCLSLGFVGRHADAPGEIERLRKRLWEKLGESLRESIPAPASSTPAVQIKPVRGIARFWILAVFGCSVAVTVYASLAGYRMLMS